MSDVSPDVSSSEDDVEVDTQSLLHNMQNIMLAMLDEVDESIETLHHLYAEVHHTQDLFTNLHLQDMLQPYFETWAKEKRISDDGLHITLTEEEQKEFGLDVSQTTVYTICVSVLQKKILHF